MKRTVVATASVVVGLMALALPTTAYAAIRVTHGSLVAGHLRIVGTGAVPRSGVTIDGGPTGVPADARGRFKFDIVGFSEPSCVATLDDGSVSVQTTLTGCTPSAPPPPVPPAAPTPTGPPGGASIVQPFALTWSAPRSNGLIGFRWQIATSPTFSALTLTDVATPRSRSTATLSGLFNGTYYWRTQAIRTAPQPLVTLHGPWSTVQSVTVTGSAPGTPAAPVLTPPAQRAYHPVESFTLSWTAVANAAKYRVEMANAAGFSPDSNLTSVAVAGTSFATPLFGFETPLFIRVRGVTAGGLQGLPSTPVTVQISYRAPVPTPPHLLAPASGATVSLPLTVSWSNDPNPQLGGYELQISSRPTFDGGCGFVELCVASLTPPDYTITSLSVGTKYWRVRSYHGESAPGVAAVTAWSATRSFIIRAVAPALVSLTIDVYGGGGTVIRSHTHVFSGGTPDNAAFGTVQLNVPAPAGGTVVSVSSTDPTVASVPATISVAASTATATFSIDPRQVTRSTKVTLSATLGAKTVTKPLTVDPPNIMQLFIGAGPPVPNIFSGGATPTGSMLFNGVAPSGSVIDLVSDSPAVSVPSSVTAPNITFVVTTKQVTATTTATITATWKGQAIKVALTLQPPTSLLRPASGAAFETGRPITFSWSGLRGLASYEIQIATSPDFANVLVDQNTSFLTQYSTSTLPNGTLFWRVRALDFYADNGPWSTTRKFTVSA